MGLTFCWDPDKAASNLRKHGVRFLDAATVFGDPLSRTIPDPDGPPDEERFLTIGVTTAGRLLVVAHADTGDTIRIISARAATRRERRSHEEDDAR